VPAIALEWMNLLLRWAHVIAGIMWIGDSFLFMWMDSSLEPPSRPRAGDVAGEMWMVHSGGFYEVVKRRSLRPEEMPRNLYWFMWQSYSTWISGAFLLAVVYWLGGGALLVDSGSRLSHGAAVAVSAGSLVAAWLLYDAACRSPLARKPWLLTLVLTLALAAAVFGFTRIFGSRAAWLQTGAMLGSIMAANVWRVIVPGQAKMLAAGSSLRWQFHYHPNGRTQVVDRTRVGIKFWPKGWQPKHLISTMALASPETLAIAPGDPAARSDSYFPLAAPARLLSYQPHMHYRGKDFEYRLVYPTGEKQTVLSVPKYDFNWQLFYYFSDPIVLPKGTKIECTAHFDNSTNNKFNPDPNKTVYYGTMTWEEMMNPFYSVVVPIGVDPRTVVRSKYQQVGGGG